LLTGAPVQGLEVVAEFLPGAAVSAVNLSEVVAKLLEATMPVDAVRSALGDLGLDIRPFDAEMAYAAGALRTTTRKRGLSLGDRACLALGQLLARPVLTTDRACEGLDLGVTVRSIR
jgi:ribonuclease VapC